jgi:hypothetical protein
MRKMKEDGRDKTLVFCAYKNKINEPFQFKVIFIDYTVPS